MTAAVPAPVPSPEIAPPGAIAGFRPIQARGVIQRCGGVQCPPGTCDHDENEKIHRFAEGRPAVARIPPSVLEVLRTAGQPLDASVRVGMEQRFGRDFAHVRVHTDPAAGRSARAIQAQAYTLGRHIVMGQDQFQPHTAPGMRLLAHELAHVVQQGNPVRDITPASAISHADDPSELQADRIAAAAGSRGPRAAVVPDPVPMPGSAPWIARQADAGVPDEESRDAGAPEADAAAARAEALNDPMYPLQAGCVAEMGGCQQYLAGGPLDPGRFRGEYNSRCRGRTQYRGPDMWPSDLECEQAKNGAILDPGRLREFKELLLEYKVRLDAGQLPPDAVSAGDAAIRTGLRALQRAGLTEEAITQAARNPPDPQVVEAFAPAAPGIIMRVVIQGGKVALVSEPAVATAATVAGGEVAGAGAAAAAGTTAAAVASVALIGLVLVGLGILIVWALLQPGMRLDPVAPKLLDESLEQLRNAARRQRQPQPQPQPQPEPEPVPLPEPERGPGGRWGCDDVRCNVYPDLSQHPPRRDCPDRVIGRSRGYPDYKSACLAAEQNANSQVPRGCIKRHCNCRTKCRPM